MHTLYIQTLTLAWGNLSFWTFPLWGLRTEPGTAGRLTEWTHPSLQDGYHPPLLHDTWVCVCVCVCVCYTCIMRMYHVRIWKSILSISYSKCLHTHTHNTHNTHTPAHIAGGAAQDHLHWHSGLRKRTSFWEWPQSSRQSVPVFSVSAVAPASSLQSREVIALFIENFNV